MNVKIDKADKSHYLAICDNEKLCYPIPWSDKTLLDCLNGNYVCFVMKYRDQIIGHMIIQQVLDEIHLHNVCILPEFRGQGLSHQWLLFLDKYANSNNASFILLEVRVSNIVAKSLYLNHQYREIGLRKDYYPTERGREDAMVMKAQVSLSVD